MPVWRMERSLIHTIRSRSAADGAPTILIVDDDREFLGDLLGIWRPKARVYIAHSGEETHGHLLHHAAPSLVLLDIDLPRYFSNTDGEEGLAILRHIKTRISPIPLVFIVTCKNSPEIKERSLSLGADRFFTKPVDVIELEEAVSAALETRRGDD